MEDKLLKKFIVLLLMLCSLLSVAGCDTTSKSSNDKQLVQAETKKLSFVVYRPTADGSEKLLQEKITVEDDGKGLPENALRALIERKPQSDKAADVVPQGTKVLGLKITADGTAYADFSKEIAKHDQGSYNEFMLTGAIVNTLTEFPEIKQVQILVEGEKVTTLSGHMDLEDPLKRNKTLLQK